jgi:hypothetical protein
LEHAPYLLNGGWQTWATKKIDIQKTTGVHKLYLKFTGGSGYLFSVNWFRFYQTNVVPSGIAFSDNFNDGNADGWTTYNGSWKVENNKYAVSPNGEAKSIAAGTNYTDFYLHSKSGSRNFRKCRNYY